MEENKLKVPQSAQRIFEQGPDSISFYCDLAQVINSGHEIVIQLYETIPGPPSAVGAIQSVRSRLRSTVTVSLAHAKNLGNNLLQQIQIETLKVETKQ